MKYNKLFFDSSPLRCCGQDPLSSLITGGFNMSTSLATSAMNNAATAKENQKNRDWQSDENQKNRDFDSNEAEKSRNWSSDEWTRQFGMQKDEWTRQFEMQKDEWYNQMKAQYGAQWDQYVKQAEYNSPAAQVHRMQQAGLNPSAVLSQGAGGLVSAMNATGGVGSPSAPAPSAPSGGSVAPSQATATGMGSPQTFDVGKFQNPMEGFGSLIRDLTEASKTNKMLEPMLQNVIADTQEKLAKAGLEEVMKEGQSLGNWIASKTKDVKVQRAYADLYVVYANCVESMTRTGYYDKLSLLTQEDILVRQLDKKLKGEDLAQAKIRTSFAIDNAIAALDNVKSQTSLNYANANKATQEALSEQQFRGLRSSILQSQGELIGNQADISTQTLQDVVQKVKVELKGAGLWNDNLEQQLVRVTNNNKTFKVDKILQWLESITGIQARNVQSAASLINSINPF